MQRSTQHDAPEPQHPVDDRDEQADAIPSVVSDLPSKEVLENPIEHGVRARAVIQGENVDEFNLFYLGLSLEWRPVGRLERSLVADVAVLRWWIERIDLATNGAISSRVSAEILGRAKSNWERYRLEDAKRESLEEEARTVLLSKGSEQLKRALGQLVEAQKRRDEAFTPLVSSMKDIVTSLDGHGALAGLLQHRRVVSQALERTITNLERVQARRERRGTAA